MGESKSKLQDDVDEQEDDEEKEHKSDKWDSEVFISKDDDEEEGNYGIVGPILRLIVMVTKVLVNVRINYIIYVRMCAYVYMYICVYVYMYICRTMCVCVCNRIFLSLYTNTQILYFLPSPVEKQQ